MKILRGILAVMVGSIVSMIVMIGIEAAYFVVYAPENGTSFMERMEAFIESLPTDAPEVVLVAWQAAAFLGGAAAALSAGRGPCLHAALVGALVLLTSVAMMMMIAHPDWLKIAGLLSPLPLSMIAGKLVSLLLPSRAQSA